MFCRAGREGGQEGSAPAITTDSCALPRPERVSGRGLRSEFRRYICDAVRYGTRENKKKLRIVTTRFGASLRLFERFRGLPAMTGSF